MAHRPPARLVLALAAVLAAASLGLVSASAADHGPSAKPASKLAGPLVVLMEAFANVPDVAVDHAAALAEMDSPLGAYLVSGLVRVSDGGVQTYISVAALDDALRTALMALGVVIELESGDGRTVQARVPLDVLLQVADLAGVRSGAPPVYVCVSAGSAPPAGDPILTFAGLPASPRVRRAVRAGAPPRRESPPATAGVQSRKRQADPGRA